MPKSYKLVTIADVLQLVTVKNLDALLLDLTGLLKNAALTKALFAITDPKAVKHLFDTKQEIVWTDDKINSQTITVTNPKNQTIAFKLTNKPVS